jgi:hypothetical protein
MKKPAAPPAGSEPNQHPHSLMDQHTPSAPASELPADMRGCHELLISTLQQIEADRLEQIEAEHLDMLAQGLQ